MDAAERDASAVVSLPEPAGFSKSSAEILENAGASAPQPPAAPPSSAALRHGSVVIAAITSCTNTSNPSVMLAAGLLAKKANALGMTVPPLVKTSLGPGSRVVGEYLAATGLDLELDALGFETVGYGCTTCIGNSGPLHPAIENAIRENNLVCASVLSGNRNFEARVHGSVRANFLMSPPLVVAYALAGRVDLDLANDPLGADRDGNPVFLKDLWPSHQEVAAILGAALDPATYAKLYGDIASANPKWSEVKGSAGATYAWDENSTYIQSPPFFESGAAGAADILGARPLAIFGDSVTTDHISPAGAIKPDSPAGRYLVEHGVEPAQFNSFGSRRGNDRVMTRGTFANVRIKNLMCPGTEGGYTIFYCKDRPITAEKGRLIIRKLKDIPTPTGNGIPAYIYDAAMAYQNEDVPLVAIAGEDYGMGSSRDWAAKGTRLLGVRAVVAKSFERIHRSNLIGMGVLPFTFADKTDYDKLLAAAPGGDATFDITGIAGDLTPRQPATLVVRPASGAPLEIPLETRLDTPAEIDYFLAGGILPYVLDQILNKE
jgi:aconitate hydratase